VVLGVFTFLLLSMLFTRVLGISFQELRAAASQRSRPHRALRFYWLQRAVDEAPGPVSAADDFPSSLQTFQEC